MKIKNIDSKKMTIILIGAFGVVVLYYFNSFLKRQKEKNKIKDAKNKQNNDNENTYITNTEGATITKFRAEQLAGIIKNSWGIFNDNESAIYDVFKQISNNQDFMLVSQAYGTYLNKTLSQDLSYRLSKNERGKINKILQSKNITYKI